MAHEHQETGLPEFNSHHHEVVIPWANRDQHVLGAAPDTRVLISKWLDLLAKEIWKRKGPELKPGRMAPR